MGNTQSNDSEEKAETPESKAAAEKAQATAQKLAAELKADREEAAARAEAAREQVESRRLAAPAAAAPAPAQVERRRLAVAAVAVAAAEKAAARAAARAARVDATLKKSALELATGLELSGHELSRSKADDARIATAADAAAAAKIAGETAATDATLKRSALELATGLELAQHEISKSTKKLTALESNKLKQSALELATGIELADYKLKHPESLWTQLTNYYTKDGSWEKFWGIFLILINLALFILLVTFVGLKKGYDNGTKNSETKKSIDIGFTIGFVFFLSISVIVYFNYIKIGTALTAIPDDPEFKKQHPIFTVFIALCILTIIGLIITFWAMGNKSGVGSGDRTAIGGVIIGIIGIIGIGIAIKKNSEDLKDWFKKYTLVFFGSYIVLFLVIFILYFTNHFGKFKTSDSQFYATPITFMILSFVVLFIGSIWLYRKWYIDPAPPAPPNPYKWRFTIISPVIFIALYVTICVVLRSQNETLNNDGIISNKNKDSIKSSVAFIVTSLNILIAFILFFNKFDISTINPAINPANITAPYTKRQFDYASMITMAISVIIIIALLVSVFDITALLINIFAAGLFALTWYGGEGLYTWLAGSNKQGKMLPLDAISGVSIGLLAVLFIAIIIGIFMLVFYPKNPDNSPNNPDMAYKNIMIIIYVLISMIIVGLLFKGYQHISQLPSIVGSGMSYIMKLMYSLIGIILYMVFMSYFYGYGGLLTIFAKKNKDGTYDSSIDHDTDKPVNPASLNKTVLDLNRSKNTAMVVLAPITILIGLYILYRGYKVESATMDKTFDTFKKVMLFIFGIIFSIHVWTLDPPQSIFHDTIKTYFSGKMLVVDIFIAIFGIIYAILSMAKGFVGPDNSVAAAALAKEQEGLTGQDKDKSPIKLIAYVILYIIFIIVTSVGLSTNYFTPYPRSKDSWYTGPTGGPTGQDKGYGVCPNNLEYKTDPEGSECIPCKETEFGCCEDGVTAKTDPDGKNCGKLKEGDAYYTVDGKKYRSAQDAEPRQARALGAIFFIILVSIVWLYFTYIELVKLGLIPENITKLEWTQSANYIRKLSMVVAGVMISSLIIYVLVTSINGLTTKDKDKKKKDQGVMPFIVNLLTILVILGLLYKILKVGSNPKVNQTYHLTLDIIFYIPCLFITLYNNLPSIGKTPPVPGVNEFTQMTYIKILLGVIALYVVYFYFFSYTRIYNNQDGTVILRDPIKLNQLTTLSDYLKLNKLDENSKETTGTDKSSEQGSINKFNYHYGMSFWVYLDSVNESQIDKYLTVLNYGDKPKVEYNPAKNIMRVSVASNDDPTNDDNRNAEPRIIYTLNKVLLQKWNNIIFNYSGGTVDVFYNGDLVASTLNVAPYMSYDALISGQDNGITGGICNVTYFTKSMTAKQIYYLYNILKDTEPPVMYDTRKTMDNITNNKNKLQFV